MGKNKLTEQTAQLAQRVYKLSEKARKENLSSLKDDVDINKVLHRDIFEYGLQLCIAGIKEENLEKILSNLISAENNAEEKRFKNIQKEAVLHILKGRHPRLFLWIVLSLLSIDELEEVKTILSNAKIRDEFNSLLEKQDENEILAGAPCELSDIASRPFSILTNADSAQLTQLLRNEEKPEVIAYILASIEPKKAAQALSSLSPDKQSDIGYRIAVMDLPGMDLLINVLKLEKKFLSLCGKTYAPSSADDFVKILKTYILREKPVTEAKTLYEKASKADANQSAQITNDLLKLMQGCPADFIKTNPSVFLNMLQEEHPKTIALIICCLEPKKAALALSFLPPNMQCDAARRIAFMDTTVFINGRAVEGGLKKLVDLLFLADREAEKTILDFLFDAYPELKEPIEDFLFTFDDIVMLDDRAIQRVLRNTEADVLKKALYCAGPETRKKIFNSISKRAAVMLNEDMEYMKPVSAVECEQAQKNFVSVIRYLEETGEIVLADYGDDEFVS